MPITNHRQVKAILYQLKKIFGTSITLINKAATTNYATGVITDSSSSTAIKKAILLPRKTTRQFDYDLSFIAANKNFTYGGMYDALMRWVIIDARDVPDAFDINANYECDAGGIRYDVAEISYDSDSKVYFIRMRGLPAVTTPE